MGRRSPAVGAASPSPTGGGGELDRLHRSTAFQGDDDLVFANPHTGRPLHPHGILKSYQRHLRAAGVRQVRFHDLRHTFGKRTDEDPLSPGRP